MTTINDAHLDTDKVNQTPEPKKFLALMTFGISHLPKQSPQLCTFYPYVGRVVKSARCAPGFCAVQPTNLGPLQHPHFYSQAYREAMLEVSQVLFLWDDLESVIAFSYSGVHKEVLKINRENKWFSHEKWPSYVAWWTSMTDINWAVGCAKLEQLHKQGSTSVAFNFSLPFDVDGNPYKVDRDRLGLYKAWYADEK